MKTKISMKTIYLILVITIGLVGLGIGSTLAVFTASAEISNLMPQELLMFLYLMMNKLMALSMLCGIFMKEIVMIYLLSEIKKVI